MTAIAVLSVNVLTFIYKNVYKISRLDDNGRICGHALVFMIRGVTRTWKQTVSYSFCKGSTKPLEIIKHLIISIIRTSKSAGLEVVATICDQATTNQSAFESLIRDSRETQIKKGLLPKRYIIVDEMKIIPLYDVPHLLKGIRNNLLKRNLLWESKDGILEAKWGDILCAYKIDVTCGDIRSIPHITDFHVNPTKIRKMRVSNASQVFSHPMAATVAIMARNNESDISGNYVMEKRAQDTSKILKFFDNLFDSLNGEKFYQLWSF